MADGWLSQIDPTSGRTYYVNLASGVSQWEPPVAASEPFELPTGWLALKDAKTGKTYYVDTTTGVTQWEPPALTSSSSPSSSSSGSTTSTLKTSTLESPSLSIEKTTTTTTDTDNEAITTTALPLPVGVPALPVGWIVLADESSGKAYYVNTKTGTSQWDPPTPPTAPNTSVLGLTPTPPLTSTTTTVADVNVLLPPGMIIHGPYHTIPSSRSNNEQHSLVQWDNLPPSLRVPHITPHPSSS